MGLDPTALKAIVASAPKSVRIGDMVVPIYVRTARRVTQGIPDDK